MKGGRSAFSRPSKKTPRDVEREGPLCRGGVLWEQVGRWKRDGECVQIRGLYASWGRSASTDLMTARLQNDSGSLCTAPINSKGGDSWWTSLLLACEECRSATKKSKKEKSWRKWQMQSECAWYASLAQLWLYCFLLPLPPYTTTTSSSHEQKTQDSSANDVICGSAEVSPHCCRTQLYHSWKQKRKIHPFIQRNISKVPQMLKSFQLCRALLATPPRSSHLSLSSSRRASLVDWAPFQTHFSCPPISLFKDNQWTAKHTEQRFYPTSNRIVQLLTFCLSHNVLQPF